jgi:hypothetical protein
MGVSSNGLIGFGIPFKEDFEFPWNEKHDGDIDDWWLDVCGFKPTLYPFTDKGDYIKEYTEKIGNDYFNERIAFKKEHPLPIEILNYCSDDYPMYMLCIKDSIITASRGYPEGINPEYLAGEEELGDSAKILMDFCKKYEIKIPSDPRWYLFSYMG